MSEIASKPILLSWLTCDAVHMDPSTGKHYLLGCFSNIRASAFPVVHPKMVWFLSLTDASRGEHQLRISMGLDMHKLSPVVDRPFKSVSPTAVINIVNELRKVTFNSPGDYTIQIEVDEEPLLLTQLCVHGVSETEHPHG